MLLELEGEGPLYTRVYDTLRRQISEGRFPSGKRLPGTRSIAKALGVSRTVVLQAYAQLEAEGYTTTRVGSGTYVVEAGLRAPLPPAQDCLADALPYLEEQPPEVPLSRMVRRMRDLPEEDRPRELLDEITGVIDLTDVAVSYDVRGLKAWRQTLSRVMDTLPTDPAGVAGIRPLRAAMLDYLHRERGVMANIEDVIIVNSAQQARDLIARALVDEGTGVGVEDPCDPGVRQAFAAAGAHLTACAVDADGLDVDAHAQALDGARVLHVAPSCQRPSGARMSAARREAVLAWAYARPVWVVEEDVDCDYRHGVRTAPSLASIDRHERVIYYMNASTQAVYPALQVSCVVVPPALREKFYALKKLMDHDGLTLRQYAWAQYLADGEYMRSLRRLSQQLSRKHELITAALDRHFGPAAQTQGQPMTGQLLVHLHGLDANWVTVLCEEALRVGLLLQPAAAWYAHAPAHATLLLHYAAVPEALLETAIERLALAWRRALTDVGQGARRRA